MASNLTVHCLLNGMLIQNEMKMKIKNIPSQVCFPFIFISCFENSLFKLIRKVNAVPHTWVNNLSIFVLESVLVNLLLIKHLFSQTLNINGYLSNVATAVCCLVLISPI